METSRDDRFFSRFPAYLKAALAGAPSLHRHLGEVDPDAITSRAALARLPVLRKTQLMEAQRQDPPFGGFADIGRLEGARFFVSPGPVYEPQPPGLDPWGASAALRAAGFTAEDRVLNTFAYHAVPGGFMLDEGARHLGANVFPAGPGNSEATVLAIASLRLTAYCGTPDFLKILLDKADETGTDVSSLRRALVSGGALFPSLREAYAAGGIATFQAYATADLGIVAYETERDGSIEPALLVNDHLLVEIVRPGGDEPLPEGEVGEVVATVLNPAYPLVRFGTGDLSAFLPGSTRLKGWMGRADQRTKVKGMFVDPAQVAALARRFPAALRLRLVVTREGEADRMTLLAEPREGAGLDPAALEAALAEATRLRGKVEIVAPGSLPNDGKVIADERRYEEAGQR